MILNGGKLIYRYIVISDIHNKTRGRRRSTFGYFIKKKSINTLSETIFLNLPTEVLWRMECE
ncbi:hypothetical protein EB1_00020 [Empedobacter brevis NBRC 14943 = ATCC 43319]|uniref:Uncharacterized protein n=1 Tax=Empedobacter brevis NBRC 14943 = ATCC 43319 TaxID=1218108 RepID=A0A511NBN2_9FLAO|nr:hypothetical protein EB1_00020 [Empedobacter brevis NBRC 14943 = ATCC 43319]